MMSGASLSGEGFEAERDEADFPAQRDAAKTPGNFQHDRQRTGIVVRAG